MDTAIIIYIIGMVLTFFYYLAEDLDEGFVFGILFWPLTWLRGIFRSAVNWASVL